MIFSDKKTLRQELILKRNSLSIDLKQSLDQAIFNNFVNLAKSLEPYRTVGLYKSKASEIDTQLFHEYLILQEKVILYPRINEISNKLDFYEVNDLSEWERGPFNIIQPQDTNIKNIADIYLVPLIGFNLSGHRIGYGQGYYDHYFNFLKNQKEHFTTIGLAYNWQQITASFQEDFDCALDYVVTHAGVSKLPAFS